MTFQIKATEQYFPVVQFIMLYKVVLTFESVNLLRNERFVTFYFSILVPPRFISPLRNTSVLINTTLNLTCEITADPEASIHWLKDDSENITRAIISQGNASLIIHNVELGDEGRYKCVVENRAGRATSEAYIEITGTLTRL